MLERMFAIIGAGSAIFFIARIFAKAERFIRETSLLVNDCKTDRDNIYPRLYAIEQQVKVLYADKLGHDHTGPQS